tara:strand:- start:1109 stop:2188 length:1080 start_codon:yes stop_codon:yes gene_type:complete
MTKKIIFSAGGTGGHIFPAINLMKHFSEKGYNVVLVTDKRGNNFLNKYSKFKSYELRTGTPTNKNLLVKILSLFIIFLSILKSAIILKKERADLIIGFGGYVSFPTSFTSKFFNIPLIIYEPNIVLGRANKYLLSIAKKVFLAKEIKDKFPEKYKTKVDIVGTIIEKKILTDFNIEKKIKKENFSILVLGGSQGAQIFGKIVPSVVNLIKKQGFGIEIYQQCIESQRDSIINYYKEKNIKNYIFEFEKNILDLILSSDLAITRCGASATAELVHTSTPFIAVPIPDSIDNHQYLNAKYYEDKGYCWILDQNNFNEKNLFNLVIEIMKDKKKLESKCENMKKDYTNNVYNVIETKIKEIL